MSTFKYYNDDGVPNNTSVWYKTLDKDGNVIANYFGRACFSELTYYQIAANVNKILIYHEKKLTPYKFETIKRWIAEINSLGFPCECSETETHYEFLIKLDDYTWKAHLVSTMMLIRALYEYGISKVPEFYLCAVDANPSIDKFQALQDAHKDSRLRYFNINHMITYNTNGKNVSRETLHNRYKDSGVKVHEGKVGWHSIGQYDKWKGD